MDVIIEDDDWLDKLLTHITAKYVNEAEVDAMTPEQQRANADKILKSMKHW